MMQLPWFLVLFIWLRIYSDVCGALDCIESNGNAITVGTSGHHQFKTIQSAIDSIPSNNHQWIKIQISPGLFMEKVSIPIEKPCIYLEGSGHSSTTISYSAHQETDTSATFSSLADNIVAKGIAFQNSYNRPLEAESDEQIKQALAARIFGDKSAFYECRFVGLQDTIWDGQGRHYFYNCYIEGAIDFIFGNGQSIYEDCSINATSGRLPPFVQAGYITAQGRGSATDPSGFVFKGGNVIGSGQNYLGRAYGPYSRVIFDHTTLSAVVAPQGWNAWTYPGQEKNFEYAEINCNGPGSDTSKRVPWMKKLNKEEMSKFSGSSFINQDGWLENLPA